MLQSMIIVMGRNLEQKADVKFYVKLGKFFTGTLSMHQDSYSDAAIDRSNELNGIGAATRMRISWEVNERTERTFLCVSPGQLGKNSSPLA